jgi:hypothetical protein
MRWLLSLALVLGAGFLGGCCCFDDDDDDCCSPPRNKPHVSNEVKHHDGWRR